MESNSSSLAPILLAIVAIVGVAALVWLLARRGRTVVSGPRVIVQEGPHRGRAVAVGAQPVTIGRDADCGIVLDGPQVSRKHAQVTFANGIFVIEDLGSAHGTFVNGQRVYQERVSPGTVFVVGTIPLSVVVAASAPQVPHAAPVAHPERPVTPPAHAQPVAPRASGQEAAALDGYEIKERIKTGGQVIVHRGVAKADGRQVAIKFLSANANDAEGQFFLRKFTQQLEVGASIRHPHCVRIYGGSATANPPYMIEEYLGGGTLLDRMRSGSLTLADVIRIIGETCDALAYLHRRDIIHRDVTPSNIMFDQSGSLKLIDFGVAHFASMPSATAVGTVIGKVKYISVEAASGNRVVPQSDLYSLGVIAYEMLAGRAPFTGSDPEVLTHHLRTRPVPLRQVNPAIPERIERAVMKALEKNPGDRHHSAEEMARAFMYEPPFSAGFADAGGRHPVAASGGPRLDETLKGPAPLRLRRDVDGQTLTVAQTGTVGTRALLNPVDTSISRSAHGELLTLNGQWHVRETVGSPSANGIWVNNVRIMEAVPLKAGDALRFGNTTFRVM